MDSFLANSCSSKWLTVSVGYAIHWKFQIILRWIFNLPNQPAAKQESDDVQYSPLKHPFVARHVAVAWQVNGPSIVSSLQDVKPVTEEQSDVTEQ